jgi:hypothetical protein
MLLPFNLTLPNTVQIMKGLETTLSSMSQQNPSQLNMSKKLRHFRSLPNRRQASKSNRNSPSLNILLFLPLLIFCGLGARPASALTLGEFLRRLGSQSGGNSCNPQARTCFQPQTTYSDWSFVEYKEGSTSSACKGIYERTIKYYSNGWQYNKQRSDGECPEWAIRKLQEGERQLYAQRLEKCKVTLSNRFRASVGDYVNNITDSFCPTYASGGDIPKEDVEAQVNQYSSLFEQYKERKAREAAAGKERALNAYNSALSWANSAKASTNKTTRDRAFVVTSGDSAESVYLQTIIIRSMNPGVTLGGSRVVDVNIRTQGYETRAAEARYRIFCNEGKNSIVQGGVIVGGSPYITGEMGRWICGRYGIYHPG